MGNQDEHERLVQAAAQRATENPTVGTHLGYEVQMAIRREPPGSASPDDFAVNLYVARSDGDNVDIARVDTAHDGCHIDRLYLPEGHDQRRHDYGLTVGAPAGAVTYMTDQGRWREWVERYEANHGLP